MKLRAFFTQVRSALRGGAADPATFYGVTYEGRFEPNRNRIVGLVADSLHASRHPPASVVIKRNGAIVSRHDAVPISRQWMEVRH